MPHKVQKCFALDACDWTTSTACLEKISKLLTIAIKLVHLKQNKTIALPRFNSLWLRLLLTISPLVQSKKPKGKVKRNGTNLFVSHSSCRRSHVTSADHQ